MTALLVSPEELVGIIAKTKCLCLSDRNNPELLVVRDEHSLKVAYFTYEHREALHIDCVKIGDLHVLDLCISFWRQSNPQGDIDDFLQSLVKMCISKQFPRAIYFRTEHTGTVASWLDWSWWLCANQ